MRKIALFMMVAFLIMAAGGCGDVPTGRLLGKASYSIFDDGTWKNGDAVHAKITMTSPGLPTRYDFSDQTGYYLIEQIEPGTYAVATDFSYATNMPALSTASDLFGEVQLGGSNYVSTPEGTYPDMTITQENVTIADDTTTVINFVLFGY